MMNDTVRSIAVVLLRIALIIFVIYLAWTAIAIGLSRTGNAAIGVVLLWTAIAFIVIFFFYEIYLWISIRRAKLCGKDCGGLCANLERDDEQVYDTSHDNLVGVVARIRNEMKSHLKDWGCGDLNDHFRHYQELSGVLIGLDKKIKTARQNRDQRDEAYSAISEGADFKDLRKYFDELTGSICAIHASIAKKGAEISDSRIRWRISILVTAVASAAAALSFLNA